MRTLIRFVQTTIFGGLFFLIPIVVLVIILAKALEYANKVLQAMVVHIFAGSEPGATTATALSIVLIALLCLLSGLIARTVTAQRIDGGRTRARTLDPLIKSQLLYQLSYAPIESFKAAPGRREARDLAKAAPPVQRPPRPRKVPPRI